MPTVAAPLSILLQKGQVVKALAADPRSVPLSILLHKEQVVNALAAHPRSVPRGAGLLTEVLKMGLGEQMERWLSG